MMKSLDGLRCRSRSRARPYKLGEHAPRHLGAQVQPGRCSRRVGAHTARRSYATARDGCKCSPVCAFALEAIQGGVGARMSLLSFRFAQPCSKGASFRACIHLYCAWEDIGPWVASERGAQRRAWWSRGTTQCARRFRRRGSALWRRRVQGEWQHVQSPPLWPAAMERRWRKGCQRGLGRAPWSRASRRRVERNAREYRHCRMCSAALGRRPQACVGRISGLRGDDRVWRRLVSGG